MAQCSWEYNKAPDIRCNNEGHSEDTPMCLEHLSILESLDAIEEIYMDEDGNFQSQASYEEYNKQWETLVKRGEEIGRNNGTSYES